LACGTVSKELKGAMVLLCAVPSGAATFREQVMAIPY
jgi:hypothetical protein